MTFTDVFPQETPEAKAKRMEWFADAKLGIFIHWGIYAVNGIDESWSFYNGKISYEDYMKQLQGFTAANYHPEQWADLFFRAGAKYVVLTSKHHDGVALWDTKMGELSVVKRSPAGRDLIGPYCAALRKKGLKVGLYFSLLDWSHPDYPGFRRNENKYEKDSLRFNKFRTFLYGQLDELAEKFNPDLYWFDGDWEQPAETWGARAIREKLLKHNPNTIINSRLQGYGDYDTPENGVPVHKPQGNWWELCMTMNDSWGYQLTDNNFKTPYQLISIFADCIGKGGNLLLDIGPKEDGSIPAEYTSCLEEFGRWTGKHAEAIYGTTAGIPRDYYCGNSTLSKDRKKLYLFIDQKPIGPIMVKGLRNNVRVAYVVGKGNNLNTRVMMKAWWSEIPGILYIDVPEGSLDPMVTVVALSLDGALELYPKP
ncbi:MAG: alpha-L-fucosidase [Bacteroidetes bacterium]|nr:alpha-L-fucosidase [Bacteroidota bacterium]